MTKQELLDKANDLPLAPGVYLMMDKTGCVIYVGKAKKLKNRVSQYFQENSSHNEKTRRMVSQVDHFDTIFVSSEFEALILENSLIKQHQPHYNILLKDDKGYPLCASARSTSRVLRWPLSLRPTTRCTLARFADETRRARPSTRSVRHSACRRAAANSRATLERSGPASTITWGAATRSAAARRMRTSTCAASGRPKSC